MFTSRLPERSLSSADSDGFVKRWENRSLGVRFDPISGFWDINGDGEKEIVAFRWIGEFDSELRGSRRGVSGGAGRSRQSRSGSLL
jgi:hypothetical protein